MSARTPLRLLVIGLDGATWDVISPMMAQGELPHLAGLMAEGASGPLTSTIPPVTAPAWSSFMTGLNPGKHGIFQWRTYDPTTYTCLNERLATSEPLVGRSFWDLLGQAGHRVGVITVPMTYPAWPVNGYLLSGYPCPDSQLNYGYPEEWAASLPESYNFQADYYLAAGEDEIWRGGLEMLRRRTSLAIDLVEQQGVEICVLVLGEIDRAQHDFWQYAHPSFPQYHSARGQRYRQVIADHYRVADEQVGRLVELASDETTVVVISDHGAGPHPPSFFHTNAWLAERGWLRRKAQRWSLSGGLRRALGWVRQALPFEEKLRRRLPKSWVQRARQLSLNIRDVDWAQTRAYRFPMYHPAEGIEINLRGRQPQGIVEPGAAYEALREEIIAALREARDPRSGAPLIHAVYRREELYTGEHAALAPDIVFLTEPNYKTEASLGSAFVQPVALEQLTKYNGLHRMEGILIARGPGIAAGKRLAGPARLLDTAPTLLYALGQPIPTQMDGQVLLEAYEPSWQAEHPPRYTDLAGPRGGATTASPALTEAEDEDMRNKLRGLGYI